MKNTFKGLIKRKGQKEEKQVKTTTTATNIKFKECRSYLKKSINKR
jgi:hypothetical protein